jgi:YD repeat-containing protein
MGHGCSSCEQHCRALDDYVYDDLYRLTGEVRTGSHPYAIAFTYDNVGNRLSQTRDGVTAGYEYNDRDQLTTETVGGASATYAFDGAGRMVSKTDGAGTTTYGWRSPTPPYRFVLSNASPNAFLRRNGGLTSSDVMRL